jgi:pyridinium-3,5-bisthiocarboxylic acid mononucleotide nickel chelatase
MPIAILDPFSGISGDMTLGALLEVGLEPDWLRALPERLGLGGVSVRMERVRRSGIVCSKVDFDIPPQPHGRHVREIREIVARAGLPERVRELAGEAFSSIAVVEGDIHGVAPERVHLHEVGAVDAILDVVGAIWGFEQLGVDSVYCGAVSLGDGSVPTAHGVLPVPAPATLKLLEGHVVRTGPEGAGELVTPTGAALVRVLSSGPPPSQYVPRRSGFGAGSRDPHGRPNALRLVIADGVDHSSLVSEQLVHLAADLDDMDGEHVARAADRLRAAGALDVVLVPTIMKKGRPGTRVEVLARSAQADALEEMLFSQTSSIGVRRLAVERRALLREMRTVGVLDHNVRVKIVTLPDGRRRAKPEFDDLQRVADATGHPLADVRRLADEAAQRATSESAPVPEP